MRYISLLIASLLLMASFAPAADFEQKWCYASADLSTDDGLAKFLALMKLCHDNGVTHMSLAEAKLTRLDEMKPAYFDRVKKALAQAKEDNIVIAPLVFPIGYSGSYFRDDPNLCAGIPAKEIPFIVAGNAAAPDPASAPKLINGNFDDAALGWKLNSDTQPASLVIDESVKHDGRASLKLSDLDKLPREAHQSIRLEQNLAVRPFQYYRVSVWIKTDKLDASNEDFFRLTSSNNMRRNTYKNLTVKKTQDWTKHEFTFNTFEADSVRFTMGVSEAKSGTIWFDDLKIEPAGMLLILRRPNKPLVVTNEDRSVTYVEGEDFEPVADPVIAQRPFKGEFDIDHEAPKLVLTKNSRIKDGQKLLVSFFHAMRVYNDQDVISIQDPKTLELMEDQMKRVAAAWPTGHYFMKYDEVRVGGWEVQPNGENLTPGQLLARNARAGYDLIQKYSPGATAYAFSDMFTPYHNARPFGDATHEGKGYYYLSNGTYEGSWEGLPKDVVIANWYSPDARTPKFFADRGHKQILCGYYDSPKMKDNITNWMRATKDVPGVIGIMYTTWRKNYDALPEYFKLVKQYPNFEGATEPTEALHER